MFGWIWIVPGVVLQCVGFDCCLPNVVPPLWGPGVHPDSSRWPHSGAVAPPSLGR